MWSLSGLVGQKHAAAYVLPSIFKISGGPLNNDQLQAALNAVAARHESLRTRYKMLQNGSLSAFITPIGAMHLAIKVIPVDPPSTVEAVLRSELAIPFDLERGPLVRMLLAHPADDASHSTLALCMHHAISDLGSMRIFWHDFSKALQLYVPGASDPSSLLPSLDMEYGDYAAWQEEQRTSKEMRADMEYWRRKLADAPDVLTIPTDRPRPSAPSFAGCILQMPGVQQHTLEAVRALAMELSCSPTVILLTAFHVLLARYATVDDVTVGVPADAMRRARRGQSVREPALQSVIGYFVYPLPVRAVLLEDITFAELAANVRDAMVEGLKHTTMPFGDVVAGLGVEKGQSYNPVFQTMFQFLDDKDPELALPEEYTVEYCHPPDLGCSQFDITLEVVGGNNSHAGDLRVEYSTQLFDESTIQGMMQSYIALVQDAVESPHKRVDRMSIISESQKKEILLFSQGTVRGDFLHGPFVHEIFFRNAASAPDSPCLIWKGITMTYGEAAEAVIATSALLHSKGAVQGHAVGVSLPRCPELVLVMLALFRLGAVYLPLEPSLPADRLAGYAVDAEVTVIVAETDTQAQSILDRMVFPEATPVPQHAAQGDASDDQSDGSLAAATEPPAPKEHALPSVLLSSHCKQASHLPVPQAAQLTPDDLSAIMFTSGSTGRPKGVEMNHGGLRDLVGWTYSGAWDATPEDVYMICISPSFDPHLGNILGGLAAGSALVILPSGDETDVDGVVRLCIDTQVTIMEQVPVLMALYAPKMEECASKLALRAVIMGGDALPLELARQLQREPLSLDVYNMYGPTEVTVTATTMLLNTWSEKVSLGPPDPNMRAYIVNINDINELLPVGVKGELLLSGPRLARGYVGRPDLTRQRFVPNPFLPSNASEEERKLFGKVYHSGDLCSWDSDGLIYFHGRFDSQVKVNGVRIELGEVETVLGSAPGVVAAAVVAIPARGGGKTLVGMVTPETVNTSIALQHCQKKLMSAAVPSNVIALEMFPLMPSGKVNLKALEVKASETQQGVGGAKDASKTHNNSKTWYVPPDTAMEVRLATVWATVLGIHEDDISAQADFFSIGGNSLKAGVVAATLRNSLAIPELPATLLYQHKTIRATASAIEKLYDAKAEKIKASFKSKNSMKSIDDDDDSVMSSLSADDINLQLGASDVIPETKLPYIIYLLAQWVMLSLTTVMVPVIWGSLLFLIFAIKKYLGSWWYVIPLWPAIGVASLFVYCALFVGLKWLLVGRLKPGIYPVYGWMYARWITLRALHEQAGQVFMPVIRRTALMPLLLRALGAKIENASHTVIDTLCIYDFDLISIGAGACIYAGASITGAFVAPCGYLGRDPALVLSPVKIGRNCHLGHRCVITAGANIADLHNVKPHAAPCHPGDAPVRGPLADHPHFTPEERLSTVSSLMCGTFIVIWESVMQVASLALVLFIISSILGFATLLEGYHTLGATVAYWALFVVLYRALSRPISMLLHALLVLCWKWGMVGRMTIGRDIASSWGSLMGYSILRRLIEAQPWQWLQDYLAATPLMAWLYRALGATVGKDIFLGGLTVVEFDALTLGDRACTGSSSRIYAVTDDGIVEKVVLANDATLGNGSTLYPGACVKEHAVVGNDTPICAERTVAATARVQGGVEYTVSINSRSTDQDLRNIENGKASANGSVGNTAPQSIGMGPLALIWALFLQLLVEPLAPIAVWLPISLLGSFLRSEYWYLIFFVYTFATIIGTVLAVACLRLLLEVFGARRMWSKGWSSCFSISAIIIHVYINVSHCRLGVFRGTPFALWIYRMLWLRVGSGTIMLGHQPQEFSLIKIGKDSVIEAGARLDGHYLEHLKFVYNPLDAGEQCWVQECGRVMPGTTMKESSRVLPGSMVLPGDTLEKDTVWGGLPAEPVGVRQNSRGTGSSRKLMRIGKIGGSSNRRRSGRKSRSGDLGGFLGNIASIKQLSLIKKVSDHYENK